MSDPMTEEMLRRPSPLVDESRPVDPWMSVDGDDVVLSSGDQVPLRVTTPGSGIVRFRVGPPTMATDSPMLSPDYTEEVAPCRSLHAGTFLAEPMFPAVGRTGGSRPGWIVTCRLGPESHIYGGGESFHGPDLRGRLRHCVNVETHGASGLDRSYLNVPFFWSDDGWGVFFHTATPMVADLGATHGETAAFAVEGDGLDVFVFSGTPMEILTQYLSVTGRPGRFPDWGLGVWSSRCSYLSAAEIEEVVASYAEAGAPLDVVHVDAWVRGNVVKDLTCSWEVDRERFPAGWTAPITNAGIRTSLWHNPYVLDDTDVGRELAARGLLLRDGEGELLATNDMPLRRVIDFTDPAAVSWWKQRIMATARAEGNVSFKPDFAEEIPPTAVCADGRTGWEIRNEYAVRYQRATHEALAELLGDDRVALFCRSGTAGAQRYPCHWVGDTPSTWTGLVTALRACLSLSLSGFALVSHDIGGFWTSDAFAHTADAFEQLDATRFVADVDPALYARWAQWGALSPVMRFHGTGRREPYAYPEPFRTIAVEACRLRQALMPYLAAAADDAAESGAPMMRPMVLAFPEDRAARDAELQYLLGPDILVAPVLEASGQVDVYVPEGQWDPLVGLKPVEGPGWLRLDVPPESFPAWVRAGRKLW